MTHAIPFNSPTYISDVIALCGARVSRQDEARQLARHAPVDCPTCLALDAEGDAAIQQVLSEKTQEPWRKPDDPDDDDLDTDDSDSDDSELDFENSDDEIDADVPINERSER